jgi:hypothetical protein
VKKSLIPTVAEVGREAIIVLAGAALAALIAGQFPRFKAWLKQQWDGSGQPPTV